MLGTVIGKLIYVQLINGDDMEKKAFNNRLRELTVKANRGVIYDRNGNALAISVEKDSVYINPRNIQKADNKDEIIATLAEILSMDLEKIEQMAEKNAQFVWVKRHADEDEVQKLREKKLVGVGFVEEPKRVYPKGTLACHVIGFAGIDNQGLNGLEMKYEDELRGTPGKLLIEYDNKSNAIPQAMQEFIPATPGYDLHLTIDETIQYIAEREITKVYQEQEPKGVTCVVMDVKTAEILAMANLPNFDPNNYNAVEQSVWTNFAVSGNYEPGSTFKILSGSIFLEVGATTPEDTYYCAGARKIGNDPTPIKCHIHPRAHGLQTFAQAVANSCNPVMTELIEKIGGDTFYQYLEGFGLREKTGIDVPGEATGITLSKERAVPRDFAAMAIGQVNAFTPIQMITAIASVANGGYLMEPHLVSKITDNEGKIVESFEPKVVRQVISEKTAKEMWIILESVVSSGTGKKGQIEGYKIAGKTGTAQKLNTESGSYDNKYVVSFAGFAPADDPQIACIVIIDEPKDHLGGGALAGPIFSNIVSDVLWYLNVPKTVLTEEDLPKEEAQVTIPQLEQINATDAINIFLAAGLNPIVQTQGDTIYAYLPPAGTMVNKGSDVLLYCQNSSETTVVLPDLTGKTIREVDNILSGLGLRAVIEGSGIVYEQTPEAGALVEIGSSVRVRCELNQTEEEEPINNDDVANSSQATP